MNYDDKPWDNSSGKYCRICQRMIPKNFPDFIAKEHPEKKQYYPCCEYFKPGKGKWYLKCFNLSWVQTPYGRCIIQPLIFELDESWIDSFRGGIMCLCGNWVNEDRDMHEIVPPPHGQQRLEVE